MLHVLNHMLISAHIVMQPSKCWCVLNACQRQRAKMGIVFFGLQSPQKDSAAASDNHC